MQHQHPGPRCEKHIARADWAKVQHGATKKNVWKHEPAHHRRLEIRFVFFLHCLPSELYPNTTPCALLPRRSFPTNSEHVQPKGT